MCMTIIWATTEDDAEYLLQKEPDQAVTNSFKEPESEP